jgi:hypothetical protein
VRFVEGNTGLNRGVNEKERRSTKSHEVSRKTVDSFVCFRMFRVVRVVSWIVWYSFPFLRFSSNFKPDPNSVSRCIAASDCLR